MTTLSVVHIVILVIAGLLAGTVDTIAGGGGLFSLPALLMIGLSPATTLGTNQFTMSFGSLVGTARYTKKGLVNWGPETILAATGVIPGAWLGGQAAQAIPAHILHLIVLILLVAVGALVTWYRKDPDESPTTPPITIVRGLLLVSLGLGIGFYEGFFGPGTGLFITMAGVAWLHFSYLRASGTAKAISLVGNVAAFLTYAAHGHVDWILGLAMAVMVSLGAVFGSWLAPRGGSRLIRRVMFGVIGIIVANLLVALVKPHRH